MANASQGSQRWVQTTVFPPEHVMATVRLAWIRETGHAQWQIEVQDPITNELFAMHSVPHRDARSASEALEVALQDLAALWVEVTDPDPF